MKLIWSRLLPVLLLIAVVALDTVAARDIANNRRYRVFRKHHRSVARDEDDILPSGRIVTPDFINRLTALKGQQQANACPDVDYSTSEQLPPITINVVHPSDPPARLSPPPAAPPAAPSATPPATPSATPPAPPPTAPAPPPPPPRRQIFGNPIYVGFNSDDEYDEDDYDYSNDDNYSDNNNDNEYDDDDDDDVNDNDNASVSEANYDDNDDEEDVTRTSARRRLLPRRQFGAGPVSSVSQPESSIEVQGNALVDNNFGKAARNQQSDYQQRRNRLRRRRANRRRINRRREQKFRQQINRINSRRRFIRRHYHRGNSTGGQRLRRRPNRRIRFNTNK